MQLTSSRTSCIKVIVNRDVASSSVGVFNSMISMASLVAFANTNRHSAHRFSLLPPPPPSLRFASFRSLYAIRINDRSKTLVACFADFHYVFMYKSFFHLNVFQCDIITSFFEYPVLTSKVEKLFLKYNQHGLIRTIQAIHCLMVQYFKLFNQLHSFLCFFLCFHDDN